MTESPRKKQLAVAKRIRVPGPDATWADLQAFGRTYDATFHLSSSVGQIASLAYRPVFQAVESGQGIGGELGLGLVRAALWFQARSDTMSGAQDFSGPEVEQLYRQSCLELHHRTGGWVDDLS